MSDNTCPVLNCKRDKLAVHLTCAACWRLVNRAKQDKLYHLFKTERGSPQHREFALTILSELNHAAAAKKG